MIHRALVALLACACEDARGWRTAPITGGTDDAADQAVVAIVKPDYSVWCTGSVIEPHTILLAAHCAIDASNFDQFLVYTGSITKLPTGTVLQISDARIDPAYDANQQMSDLALLTVRQKAPGTPLAVDRRTPDSSWIGQTVQVVGYGPTAAGANDEGTRRSGSALVSTVGASDFTTGPGASQPCAYDLGGPALFSVAGQTVVSGVFSHGDCTTQSTFERIDVAQASFIQPYLARMAITGLDVGVRCYYDEQCRSGLCLVTGDEPRLSFCSQACKSQQECPPSMICAAQGCIYRTPSPTALGSSCAAASDCLSGMCDATAQVCTVPCTAMTATGCPSGFECRNLRCLPGPMPQFNEGSPGCSCAVGFGGPSGGFLAVILSLAALRHRLPKKKPRDFSRGFWFHS